MSYVLILLTSQSAAVHWSPAAALLVTGIYSRKLLGWRVEGGM